MNRWSRATDKDRKVVRHELAQAVAEELPPPSQMNNCVNTDTLARRAVT